MLIDWVKDLATSLPTNIVSHHCLGCAQSSALHHYWCSSCRQLLIPETTKRCKCCGIAIASGELCGHCISHPPEYDQTFVFDDYRWPLNKLILRFKHQRQPLLGRALAELFYQQHPNLPTGLLCPVPMHWFKKWRRGFNQSLILTQTLARYYQCDYRELFIKPHKSVDLIGLSRTQRRKIVKKSYQLKANQACPKRVILVDDVMTTGATLNELAHQLKQAGVSEVHCWVIARTPSPYAA
ncbi:ComF family protein [Celerinatantimonas sp. MCCC 1A17872]|uniref:ComF family protein n=1 Tax=Celerinatantimonas sp. MCCC 1A17872 TaxID=3177514 RepID=UPI0038CB3553